MKTIRIIVMICSLLLFTGSAAAYVFTDDFSGDSINTSFWTISANQNTVLLDKVNQRIVMTQQGNSGTSGLGFDRYSIPGDFDLRVDYEILTPRPADYNNGNQERIGLGATGIGSVVRLSDGYFGDWSEPGGGEVYLTDFQPMGGWINPWPGIITTDLKGKLRLTRVGSTLSGYYWNGVDWTPLHQAENGYADPTQFGFSIWNGYYDQTGMQIAFDNFYLDAPGWAGPPPVIEVADLIVVLQVLTGLRPPGVNRPALALYPQLGLPAALHLLRSLARLSDISGASPLGQATALLFRMDQGGNPLPLGNPAVLAQATTDAAGAYTVTLPAGTALAGDLVVQVTNASPAVPLRIGTANAFSAPAIRNRVDINVASETVLRRILACMAGRAGAALGNYTNTEIAQLIDAIDGWVNADAALAGGALPSVAAYLTTTLAETFSVACPVLSDPGPGPLTVLPAPPLPAGQVGSAYSSRPILAVGGTPPLTFDAVGLGLFPPGLALDAATGMISGTPTTAGSFTFSARARDSSSGQQSATRMFTISITAGPPAAGVLERISVDSAENQANGASPPTDGWSKNSSMALSDDGRFVAFVSSASNLVPGDGNGKADVFVRDRQTGETTRVSVASNGAEANGDSACPSISADGRFVVFTSTATNLNPLDSTNPVDIFWHDRNTGQTRLVNVDDRDPRWTLQLMMTIVGRPAISADGRYVAYSNAGAAIYLHDMTGGGFITLGQTPGGSAIFGSEHPVLSGDGSLIAFTSDWDLQLPGDNDTNKAMDVFFYNRITGQTLRLTNASLDSSYSYHINGIYPYVSISRDGRFVAYASRDPEVAGDTNDKFDIFVREIQGVFRDAPGPLRRVSVDSSGAQGDGDSLSPSINATGRIVAFASWAANLVSSDTNNVVDIFAHDLSTSETRLISASGNLQGNGHSFLPAVSPDGTVAAFVSQASNLVPADTNAVLDVLISATGSGASLIPPIQYCCTESGP